MIMLVVGEEEVHRGSVLLVVGSTNSCVQWSGLTRPGLGAMLALSCMQAATRIATAPCVKAQIRPQPFSALTLASAPILPKSFMPTAGQGGKGNSKGRNKALTRVKPNPAPFVTCEPLLIT